LSSEVYGIVYTAFAFSGFIGPIIIYMMHNSGIEHENNYLTVYLSGTVLCIISIVICLFTKENKFNY